MTGLEIRLKVKLSKHFLELGQATGGGRRTRRLGGKKGLKDPSDYNSIHIIHTQNLSHDFWRSPTMREDD